MDWTPTMGPCRARQGSERRAWSLVHRTCVYREDVEAEELLPRSCAECVLVYSYFAVEVEHVC